MTSYDTAQIPTRAMLAALIVTDAGPREAIRHRLEAADAVAEVLASDDMPAHIIEAVCEEVAELLDWGVSPLRPAVRFRQADRLAGYTVNAFEAEGIDDATVRAVLAEAIEGSTYAAAASAEPPAVYRQACDDLRRAAVIVGTLIGRELDAPMD